MPNILSADEKAILKDLAAQLAGIAALPQMQQKRAMWVAHNQGQGQRPMVLIDQIPWHEMDVDGSLACRVRDPYWQDVEQDMRRTLYRWRHLPADMIVNPYLCLPQPLRGTWYGVDIVEDSLATDASNDVVSHAYVNQIRDEEDLQRITAPTAVLDKKAQAQIGEQAEDLFAGVLPWKMAGVCPHLGLWDHISMWMGVQDIYFDLIDRPELLHALMEKMTDATVTYVQQLNRDGLIDVYRNMCHCSCTLSGDLPPADMDPARPTAKDGWAFGMAQLFSSVSPQVTAEFEVPYMQRIFSLFGAIYYGCCDRLDDRLDVILQMPNIRKVSCSPWSDRDAFAEKLPKGLVMSAKPTPAPLAVGARWRTCGRTCGTPSPPPGGARCRWK